MKRLMLLTIISIFSFAVHAQSITGIKVIFQTGADDKDYDTRVDVTYKTAGDVIMGQKSDNGTRYPDQGVNTLPLDLSGGPFSVADLVNSKLDIRIYPNGHDTWRFDYDIQVSLDNGNTLDYPVRGWVLSQDNAFQEQIVPHF
jgi:hypothetical protein